GARTESRPAIVVDHGFLPGGEDEFEALLRGWCAWGNERGLDTLSIFSSDGSPGYDLLRSLASTVEPFFVWTPGIEEPAGSAERAISVDRIFFWGTGCWIRRRTLASRQPICKVQHRPANSSVLRKRRAR